MDVYGMYHTTLYRNEDSSFTVFVLRLYKPLEDFPLYKEVLCSGNIMSSIMFSPLKVSGEIKEEDKRLKLKIELIEQYSISEEMTIEYLSSDLFTGIGPALAQSIVASIGKDIFNFASRPDAVDRLLEIPKITKLKAEEWLGIINKTQNQKEIIEYMTGFGCHYSQVEMLFQKYYPDALLKIKTIPYIAGYKSRIPFSICDKIARENNFQYDDPQRLKALILSVLEHNESSGSIYLDFEVILRRVNFCNKKYSAFPDNYISKTMLGCILSEMEQVKIEYGKDFTRVYFSRSYENEKTIARNVKRLCLASEKYRFDITNDVIPGTEKALGITYSKKQKECFYLLNKTGVACITGGPGTGKSTVLNGMVYAYSRMFPSKTIVQMAPTGRASQRIKEITGREAGTVHRLLDIKPYVHNIDNKYNGDYPADLVIVDESSMLDTEITAILMKSLAPNALLLFVGDVDQLPSVGSGSVLADIISSDKYITTVRLDVNYRQSGVSTIIENAIKVNSGKSDLITDGCFKIIECDEESDIYNHAIENFLKLYKKDDPYNVQILSSVKQGVCGTYNLNKTAQSIINPDGRGAETAHSRIKINDKVMTVSNNYSAGYFNGDVGVVRKQSADSMIIDFGGEEKEIFRSDYGDLELAYSMTIHKSQGSEYKTVIICLPAEPRIMLKRNILYTAITRAKQNVLIITQKECVDKAVHFVGDNDRSTALKEKIYQEMGRAI